MIYFHKGERQRLTSVRGGTYFVVPFSFWDENDESHYVCDLFAEAPYDKAYHDWNIRRAEEEESSYRRQLMESGGRSLNFLSTWFMGDPTDGLHRPEEFLRNAFEHGRTLEEYEFDQDHGRWTFSGRLSGGGLPFLFFIFDPSLIEELKQIITSNQQ